MGSKVSTRRIIILTPVLLFEKFSNLKLALQLIKDQYLKYLKMRNGRYQFPWMNKISLHGSRNAFVLFSRFWSLTPTNLQYILDLKFLNGKLWIKLISMRKYFNSIPFKESYNHSIQGSLHKYLLCFQCLSKDEN